MKRSLALFLAFLMLISFVPFSVFSADDINVYISVAANGGFVADKNGEEIAMREIAISNENPVIDDVFTELHNLYYDDEISGYQKAESSYGTMITSFFGKPAEATCYMQNHSYAMSINDSVNDGDYIVLFFYQDTETWSDKYVKFDNSNITCGSGEIITLTLTDAWGIPVTDAKITLNGEELTEKVTDENGMVALEFDDEGKYLISAKSDSEKIIPPVSVITVTDDENGNQGETPDNENDNENNHENNTGNTEDDTSDTPEEDEILNEDDILSNIAKTYLSSSAEWKLMDMMAYEELYPLSQNKVTDDAKQNYINTVIPKINISLDESELAKSIIVLTALGTDSETLYPVNSNTSVSAVDKLLSIEENSISSWVAPYVILALSQKDYASDKVNSIISSIIALQNEDGSFTEYGSSVDTTANMIACLSLYYNENEEVKVALDKAVDYLSLCQNQDGTFDSWGYGADTNTTSMVIIALASLGINPDTDSRFIKNDVSVYDTLYTYITDDLSGFGYQDNTYNDYSTEQAFRAILAAKNVFNDNEAYNIYDFSHKELLPGRAVGTGSVSRPSTPDTDNTITVYVTIKGSINYWLRNSDIVLNEESTIYHAITKACEVGNILCFGAEDGYIYKMEKDNESLEEFGDGSNSGWLYKVNGTVPNTGILEYELEDGDKLTFFYTTDWTEVSGVTISGAGLKKEETTDKESLKEETNIEENTKILDSINDISNHWAKESISYVIKKGYMKGTGNDTFEPDSNLNRSMLVTVLYRIAGEPKDDLKNPFTDVGNDEYYTDAVKWAYNKGIVNGTGKGVFNSELSMTREEFVTMLYRYIGDVEIADLRHFNDAEQISDWAVEGMKWAVKNGIIKGKTETELAPKDKITRAEAATLINNLINK